MTKEERAKIGKVVREEISRIIVNECCVACFDHKCDYCRTGRILQSIERMK